MEREKMTDSEYIIKRLEEKLRKFEHDSFIHKIEMDMIESRKKQIDEIAEHMKKYGIPPIYGCFVGNNEH